MSGKDLTKNIKTKVTTQYPFSDMEVGDFFYLKDLDGRGYDNVRASVHAQLKRHGRKFTTKTTGDEVKVVRVD